ncbi:hypothetical protein [Paraburkholderia ferrariae]|uniref:Exo-alpha-sialidase n=1 Tax=Paraburkholderia ferrariae TaxID=386056 RepID=A0ABU9RMB3_9BURK
MDAHTCGPWKYAGGLPNVAPTIAHANDLFRLGADFDTAYVGVDMRWRLPVGNPGVFGTQSNLLMACSTKIGACEMASVADTRVVNRVVSVDGPNLLAAVETYSSDSLNQYETGFASSSDGGKTWSPIKLPEPCPSMHSCRMITTRSGNLVFLATKTSSQSPSKWPTNIYRSPDHGQRWVRETGEQGEPSHQWSAYIADDGVYMVTGDEDHPTSIIKLSNGRDQIVFGLPSSLHGRIMHMTGSGDALYALVETGIYPQQEYRLYAIQNGHASELWRDNTLAQNVWANDQIIVLKTEDFSFMVLPQGVFRSILQISSDRGRTWRRMTLPDALSDCIVEVVNSRVWVVTSKGVWYRDVT